MQLALADCLSRKQHPVQTMYRAAIRHKYITRQEAFEMIFVDDAVVQSEAMLEPGSFGGLDDAACASGT